LTGNDDYVIRGGIEGRDRLRVLSRTIRPGTSAFLDRLGIEDGLSALDVGCGGGDITVELARRVGPTGSAVGVDIDESILELARQEARDAGVGNIQFRTMDIRADDLGAEFDVIYARFLLTHLSDPDTGLAALWRHLRPGGVLAVEDIDFSGAFTWPESEVFGRYYDLYASVVRRRGGDPDIGRRLPLLLADRGFADVRMHVVQPMGTQGDVKRIDPITMENIADAVVRDGLASREETDALVGELHAFAADPGTLVAMPRIVQVWGRRPTG
jgi:SAM-dependent methyltransferase